jgi:hypothetical protein
MNPDLLAAIERLRGEGALAAEPAARLRRIAGRELVSIHTELRIALYTGVLLLTSGVGLLLKQNLERIGPTAVAVALALVTALCFAWIVRHAPRFTWDRAETTHIAFDYILLLGVLLGAADLAYIEAQFTPLGPQWPWHLLFVSLLAAGVAFRYDSRVVFSLALSTFAAWRGVSVSLVENTLWRFTHAPGSLRANAIFCGAFFVLAGFVLSRSARKPHFEPVAAYMGWSAAFCALVSGIGIRTNAELFDTLLLLAVGSAVIFFALRVRRFPLFTMSAVASYVALSALFHRLRAADEIVALWYVLTSIALLIALVLAQRTFKEDA